MPKIRDSVGILPVQTEGMQKIETDSVGILPVQAMGVQEIRTGFALVHSLQKWPNGAATLIAIGSEQNDWNYDVPPSSYIYFNFSLFDVI